MKQVAERAASLSKMSTKDLVKLFEKLSLSQGQAYADLQIGTSKYGFHQPFA